MAMMGRLIEAWEIGRQVALWLTLTGVPVAPISASPSSPRSATQPPTALGNTTPGAPPTSADML